MFRRERQDHGWLSLSQLLAKESNRVDRLDFVLLLTVVADLGGMHRRRGTVEAGYLYLICFAQTLSGFLCFLHFIFSGCPVDYNLHL